MKRKLALLLSTALLLTGIAGCAGGTAGSGEEAAAAGNTSANDSSREENSENNNEENGRDTGEADGSEGTQEEVTITFVAPQDDSGTVKEIIQDFEAAYPHIKVDYQELPGASDDVKQTIVTNLAAQDSSMDVFAADIIWISQFASAGWLLDVSDEVAEVASEHLAGPLSTTEYEEKNYGFPYWTDVGLLYYRTDIIDTPPTTWDELVELSREYIGTEGIDYGYVFQAFQGEPVVCNTLEFIKQNGGDDLVNGAFSINSDQAAEALNFEISLMDEGITPEGALTHRPDDTRAIFEEGKALFMRNWTFAYALAESENSKVAGNVGVTFLPTGPSGTESSGTLGGWNVSINTYSEKQDAAITFAKYLTGSEAQKKRTIGAASFPTLKSLYEDADIAEILPFLEELASALDEGKPRPQVTDYSEISSIMQEYFHKALTGDEEVAAALDQLNDALNTAYEAQQE